MARNASGKARKTAARKSLGRNTSAKARRGNATRKTAAKGGSGTRLIVRVKTATAERERATRAATPLIPVAQIHKGGGTVSVQITFGHAQHSTYTIVLYAPDGTTELARESGMNTDAAPDRFELAMTPAQLDQHYIQWSGSVDAFSAGPGQRYSVIFEVMQKGVTVPDGRDEKSGPLNVTQAFVGAFKLVAS
jgi:hypothetical protein